MISTLLTVFIILCVVGLILWGVRQIPGLPPMVSTVVIVIAGVILLLWALQYIQGGHLTLR